MNERIQKWLENHLVRDEYTEFGWQERHRYEFDEHEIKKFAQLIVRECITVINQLNGVGDDDVIRITKDVEKHFGVEE